MFLKSLKINQTSQVISVFLTSLVILFVVSTSFAGEAWLSEFEDIASRTEESGTMGREELKTIMERCDKLRSVIEKSEDPQKNVYLFRLDKAKKLFLFVLESNG